MNFNLVVPFFSTAMMGYFAFDVLRKYVRRPSHLHLLFWGIGLAMFGIGSLAEAVATLVFSPVVFVAWYLFGAALNAAWIGHGTLLLLVRKRWVHVLTALLVVGSVVAGILMLTTPLDSSHFTTAHPISEQYATREYKPGDYVPAGITPIPTTYRGQTIEALPGVMPLGAPVRLATPFFNIYGLLTLVGGAIYSAYLFWRKRVLPNRVLGNVLIAAGALSIGFASSLTRLGFGAYLYVGELIAVILMYIGFVQASKPAAVPAARSAPSAQGAEAK